MPRIIWSKAREREMLIRDLSLCLVNGSKQRERERERTEQQDGTESRLACGSIGWANNETEEDQLRPVLCLKKFVEGGR